MEWDSGKAKWVRTIDRDCDLLFAIQIVLGLLGLPFILFSSSVRGALFTFAASGLLSLVLVLIVQRRRVRMRHILDRVPRTDGAVCPRCISPLSLSAQPNGETAACSRCKHEYNLAEVREWWFDFQDHRSRRQGPPNPITHGARSRRRRNGIPQAALRWRRARGDIYIVLRASLSDLRTVSRFAVQVLVACVAFLLSVILAIPILGVRSWGVDLVPILWMWPTSYALGFTIFMVGVVRVRTGERCGACGYPAGPATQRPAICPECGTPWHGTGALQSHALILQPVWILAGMLCMGIYALPISHSDRIAAALRSLLPTSALLEEITTPTGELQHSVDNEDFWEALQRRDLDPDTLQDLVERIVSAKERDGRSTDLRMQADVLLIDAALNRPLTPPPP